MDAMDRFEQDLREAVDAATPHQESLRESTPQPDGAPSLLSTPAAERVLAAESIAQDEVGDNIQAL